MRGKPVKNLAIKTHKAQAYTNGTNQPRMHNDGIISVYRSVSFRQDRAAGIRREHPLVPCPTKMTAAVKVTAAATLLLSASRLQLHA